MLRIYSQFGAVDKIAPQWLAMGVLNLISALYVVRNNNLFSIAISHHLRSWITILYGAFLVWASLSVFTH